ncbi:multiple sugar transport system permease protein [Nocardiopsis mwathae]|uniref:Multiple sugar transport system permease protein n=1 Tax=Nocardiopsis mwathae TaxID=1472723 RepID=A0A7W9YE93_9ACTN|nr:carbohydrate ABC transporter permease [Nocardiopsis mwathae]MBB6170548.1 multiple sugar transport system permease protein [Nocardiopsis mwathae]
MSTTATRRAATSPAGSAPPPRRRVARRRLGRRTRVALRYGLLVLIMAISIGPFLWQLSTALKGIGEDIYASPPRFLPDDPTLGNFVRVGEVLPVWGYVWNSVRVALATVVLNVVGASLAGYALARLRFRGRKAALAVFVLALLVPGEAIMVALFLMMRSVSLNDSLVAVVLPGMVGALNVLLMYNAFLAQAAQIDEAAMIDGANAWQRFTLVALPSVKGTIAVVAIFAFMGAWDDFLWPLIVLSDPANYTLTIGLNYLKGTFVGDQRLIAAGTVIAVAPLILLFLTLQRYFFRGVNEGAIKG